MANNAAWQKALFSMAAAIETGFGFSVKENFPGLLKALPQNDSKRVDVLIVSIGKIWTLCGVSDAFCSVKRALEAAKPNSELEKRLEPIFGAVTKAFFKSDSSWFFVFSQIENVLAHAQPGRALERSAAAEFLSALPHMEGKDFGALFEHVVEKLREASPGSLFERCEGQAFDEVTRRWFVEDPSAAVAALEDARSLFKPGTPLERHATKMYDEIFPQYVQGDAEELFPFISERIRRGDAPKGVKNHMHHAFEAAVSVLSEKDPPNTLSSFIIELARTDPDSTFVPLALAKLPPLARTCFEKDRVQTFNLVIQAFLAAGENSALDWCMQNVFSDLASRYVKADEEEAMKAIFEGLHNFSSGDAGSPPNRCEAFKKLCEKSLPFSRMEGGVFLMRHGDTLERFTPK
ncbi:MAG: hypothetical protein PHS57_09450 [Alphaproteobacteria bacterium]|nr:hypothetical protein [Alphaproteobacteria bacterium]